MVDRTCICPIGVGDGREVRQAEFVSIDPSENLRVLIAEGLESGEGRAATEAVIAELRKRALDHQR